MKIVTLTLNPAYDTHCSLDVLSIHHENFAKVTSTDAGGKGVNISRALTKNGTQNLAIVITGLDNGGAFLKSLEDEGLTVSAIPVPGRIRENMTVHEKGGAETRISFEGFECDPSVLGCVRDSVGDVDKNTIVTLTGSNPVGLSTAAVTELLSEWKARGAKIVIDSRSFSPTDLADFGPWLIKPNKDEAAAFAGEKVETTEQAAKAALDFYNKGVQNVIISLGEDGAVLACDKGVFCASAPKIEAVSTIGAGDSMIAGFVAAAASGLDIENALVQAIAYGSAACLKDGTQAPEPDDIERIKKDVKVIKTLENT